MIDTWCNEVQGGFLYCCYRESALFVFPSIASSLHSQLSIRLMASEPIVPTWKQVPSHLFEASTI